MPPRTAPAAATAFDGEASSRPRFVDPNGPGIGRRRASDEFEYLDPAGKRIRDADVLVRIRSIAIPPAWTDVWICPTPDGHIQATGRDARGRKQYRYHPAFRAGRDDDKFGRLVRFAERLPRIRRRVDRDLARRGLPRDKVLAAVVRLLELTRFRIGNPEYARMNRSFGLSTLRDRHAHVAGSRLRFRFRGKVGRLHEAELVDRRLAGVVRRCRELPGQELFQYVEDGEVGDITSDDVNAYIRAAAGADFSAKDFRTWAATVLAYRALRDRLANPVSRRPTAIRRLLTDAIRETADALGNTPTVTRQSYVHPAVVEAFASEAFAGEAPEPLPVRRRPPRPDRHVPDRDEELELLRLLRATVSPRQDRGRRRRDTAATRSQASRPARRGGSGRDRA